MLIQDIPQQLQDREILWFREILSADDFTLEKVFATDAEFVDTKGNLEFAFQNNHEVDSYQISFPTWEERPVNGYGVEVEISGWKELSYIALGFREEGKYYHVKIVNPIQNKFFDFCVAFNDLAWGWSNNWENLNSRKIDEVRFYIKGIPDATPSCKLKNVWVWEEAENSQLVWGEHEEVKPIVVDILNEYLKGYFPDFIEQAEKFLKKGLCPLSGGVALEWPANSQLPLDFQSNGTGQYSWHALHPATFLMLNALNNDSLPSLMAARDFVTQWFESSFYRVDSNRKYAWYDHGVAERTLALLMLYFLGQKNQFDLRFMNRLAYAIYRHAQLLASEVFYACHQSSRYHNHAWFQDFALIVVSAVFPHWSSNKSWTDVALFRLDDQVDKLIINESKYSIVSENSFGYHQGVERLVSSFESFVNLLDIPNNIFKLKHRLNTFTSLLSYPNGEDGPSQGDTFRLPNPNKKEAILVSNAWSSEQVFLPDSGYFIAKGLGLKKIPWALTVFATNKNSTHKHEDDLSFVFWLDGIEWLIDPSFYSHEYSDELPSFLRSAQAHNMLCIKNMPYDFQPKKDRTELRILQSSDNFCSIQGVNRSYEKYEIFRQLELTEHQSGLPFLKVKDSYASLENKNENHRATLCFHFGDGVVINQLESQLGWKYQLIHSASERRLVLQFMNNSLNEPTFLTSWSGLGFLEKIPTQRLEIDLPVNGHCTWGLYIE